MHQQLQSYFLQIRCLSLCGWTIQYLALLEGCLGSFRSSVVANNTVMNILIYASHTTWDKFLGILGQSPHIISKFPYKGNSTLSHQCMRVPLSLKSLPSLHVIDLLKFCKDNTCAEVYLNLHCSVSHLLLYFHMQWKAFCNSFFSGNHYFFYWFLVLFLFISILEKWALYVWYDRKCFSQFLLSFELTDDIFFPVEIFIFCSQIYPSFFLWLLDIVS